MLLIFPNQLIDLHFWIQVSQRQCVTHSAKEEHSDEIHEYIKK